MTSPPANQYTEPSNVYVNTGSQRTSSSLYRGSDEVYDDVQAQRLSLMCKEPPYDNHIMVKTLQRGEEVCPLKNSDESPTQTSPTTSKGGTDNVEELYTKPAAFKKKTDDDGYDSCNSTSSIPLQEGENLLVENELYHSKNKRQMWWILWLKIIFCVFLQSDIPLHHWLDCMDLSFIVFYSRKQNST